MGNNKKNNDGFQQKKNKIQRGYQPKTKQRPIGGTMGYQPRPTSTCPNPPTSGSNAVKISKKK